MKICKECKFFKSKKNDKGLLSLLFFPSFLMKNYYKCTHELAISVDIISGEKRYNTCEYMRYFGGMCKTSGILFEEKP